MRQGSGRKQDVGVFVWTLKDEHSFTMGGENVGSGKKHVKTGISSFACIYSCIDWIQMSEIILMQYPSSAVAMLPDRTCTCIQSFINASTPCPVCKTRRTRPASTLGTMLPAPLGGSFAISRPGAVRKADRARSTPRRILPRLQDSVYSHPARSVGRLAICPSYGKTIGPRIWTRLRDHPCN